MDASNEKKTNFSMGIRRGVQNMIIVRPVQVKAAALEHSSRMYSKVRQKKFPTRRSLPDKSLPATRKRTFSSTRYPAERCMSSLVIISEREKVKFVALSSSLKATCTWIAATARIFPIPISTAFSAMRERMRVS